MSYQKVIYFVLIDCCILLVGCMSYSTFQRAQTLEPGKQIYGGGLTAIITDEGIQKQGLTLESYGRFGVVQNFDMGAKWAFPSSIFIDGKVQFLKQPITLSFDLGWSYFSMKKQDQSSLHITTGNATGWYPMLIVGQEKWYVAVKGVYFLPGKSFSPAVHGLFEGSGWLSTNLVAGKIFGNTTQLIPELNVIIPKNGDLIFTPAMAFQFVF